MLDNLKNQIHQGINELFASAALDEMAGDAAAYKEKLLNIAQICDVLGISVELREISLHLKNRLTKI